MKEEFRLTVDKEEKNHLFGVVVCIGEADLCFPPLLRIAVIAHIIVLTVVVTRFLRSFASAFTLAFRRGWRRLCRT